MMLMLSRASLQLSGLLCLFSCRLGEAGWEYAYSKGIWAPRSLVECGIIGLAAGVVG